MAMKIPVLRYYGMGAAYAGEYRHPQDYLRDVGVSYLYASCHSVADVWFFWGPYGKVDDLPEWLLTHLTDIDPMEFWGDCEAGIPIGKKIVELHKAYEAKQK